MFPPTGSGRNVSKVTFVRILVVEDDDKSASYLVRGLRESDMIVDRAADGELGLSLASEGIYDLLIIDRLLPRLDGLQLVKSLRRIDTRTPILMLSAVAGSMDRIEGLRNGCDDYLAKPYAFRELLARIEALLRRAGSTIDNDVLDVAGLKLNVVQRSAVRDGRAIQLQLREVLLLQTLMLNAGKVVTRSMLLEAAWDYQFEPRGNIVDMHIHRIRKKIDDEDGKSLIQTIAGAGYMFIEPSRPQSRT
jgi:two-component system OmpR family response regulator